MGIAKNIKSLQPGETGGNGYSVKHWAGDTGGTYTYSAKGQTGGMPYGGGVGNTQRQAMAQVALRIRSVMNNRPKSERRGTAPMTVAADKMDGAHKWMAQASVNPRNW